MTKNEAKYIAAGLDYLMQQIRAKETPCDHDSEGNVVAHTTSLITEVMEIEIEKIHAFIERASETAEEREEEARQRENETRRRDAAVYRAMRQECGDPY